MSESAGEKYGIKGRLGIRKAPPRGKTTSAHVGLWDIKSRPVHELRPLR